MKNKAQWSITIIVLLLSGLSCIKDSEIILPPPKYEPPQDIRQIIPMRVGTSWTYRDSYFTCGGLPPCYSGTGTITKRVVSHYESLSMEYYIVTGGFFSFYDGIDSSREIVTENEYSRNFIAPGITGPEEIILRAPIRSGTRWESPWGDVQIVNVDTTVAVPMGTFEHAIYVRGGPGGYLLEFFLVPGVGIVKEKYNGGFFSIDAEFELLRFDLEPN
ncbi:MAG: hypothetical protein HY033_00705 [Ignavibacteriae bacterium]|nr:hypothetical protein [Ignavibacteria bacterium]MBI3363409.1 hypothetical protein [Ignavibacteriota bacterium]